MNRQHGRCFNHRRALREFSKRGVPVATWNTMAMSISLQRSPMPAAKRVIRSSLHHWQMGTQNLMGSRINESEASSSITSPIRGSIFRPRIEISIAVGAICSPGAIPETFSGRLALNRPVPHVTLSPLPLRPLEVGQCCSCQALIVNLRRSCHYGQ